MKEKKRKARKYGVLDEGKHNFSVNGKMTEAYKCWHGIFGRVYYTAKNAYVGCSIADDWHSFQNFAKWFEENHVEGWEIDKDILVPGNRVYSPENCCFVPKWLNAFFATDKKRNKSGYIGVNFHKATGKYRTECHCVRTGKQLHLGIFDTAREAYTLYLSYRIQNFIAAAEKAEAEGVSEKVLKAIAKKRKQAERELVDLARKGA